MMRMVDIICDKRDGKAISVQDIKQICTDYQNNLIPDYQVSALLMAIYFNGLCDEELLSLTTAMTQSGNTINVPTNNFVVDKHSTGGVGDKISLALSPILAALDFSLVKLSGRGLGHTGGTIDKFESLPNFDFQNNAGENNLKKMLLDCKFALLSASDDIVPLDKKLYALRDVTGTVKSIPLIASSIMSKKLAVKSDAIILDVKVGSGAFMNNLQEAKDLALTMQKIGHQAGRKVGCVLSDMDQPLGYAVGNALELQEAVDVLQNKAGAPQDFLELLYVLAGIALQQRGDIKNYADAKDIVQKTINTGKPLELLGEFVTLCGADASLLENKKYLGVTKKIEIPTNIQNTAYVKAIDALAIGNAAMLLGAGRATKEDIIYHEVGVVLHKKRGDKIDAGEGLATLHYGNNTKPENMKQAEKLIAQAYSYGQTKVEMPIVHEVL